MNLQESVLYYNIEGALALVVRPVLALVALPIHLSGFDSFVWLLPGTRCPCRLVDPDLSLTRTHALPPSLSQLTGHPFHQPLRRVHLLKGLPRARARGRCAGLAGGAWARRVGPAGGVWSAGAVGVPDSNASGCHPLTATPHALPHHSLHSSVPDVGLANAGEYLRATFGAGMASVFGVGLLAAGQSSTMTGTYAGQVRRWVLPISGCMQS